MSKKHYYLVSSLPTLRFGAKPEFSREYFLEQAEKWLSSHEIELLRRTNLSDFEHLPGDSDFLKRWKSFEKNLRYSLADIRRARRGSGEPKIPVFLKDIFTESNPLHVEQKILQLRWNFLESQQSCFYFDLNWLMIYFLKFQIIERMAAFSKEKGKEVFMKLCEVTYE